MGRKHNNFYATTEQKQEYVNKITQNVYSNDTQFKMLLELVEALDPNEKMYNDATDLLCAKITGNISQKQSCFINNLILRGVLRGLIKNTEITLKEQKPTIKKWRLIYGE